jgi:hypothetical protein
MTKPLKLLALTSAVATLGIAASVFVKPAQAAIVTIDDFQTFQLLGGGATFPANPVGPSAPTSIIGQFRTLNQVTAPIGANISAGSAAFTGAVNATGEAELVWSGAGTIPDGLGGVNLDESAIGANPRFSTVIGNALNLAGTSEAVLEVFEVGNATPATNTVNLSGLSTNDNLEFLYGDFTLPDPTFDFGSIGAIRLTVTLVSTGPGALPSLSFSNSLVVVPFNFQSTLGLIALAGMGAAYGFSKKRNKKALNTEVVS